MTALSNDILNENCFRYEYDQRGRMTMKKVPGADEVWMVYDKKDRLVLSQDAAMRAQGKWMYTVYDLYNRPTSTGLWNNTQDRNTHKAVADDSVNYPNLSGQTFEELSNTFYDDYTWRSAYGNPLSAVRNDNYDSYLLGNASAWPYPQPMSSAGSLKGKLTGTRVKVLGSSPVKYLYTVNFYDVDLRLVQVQSTNITDGTDIATTQYCWNDQPVLTIQKQAKGGTTTKTSVIISKMTYDDLWRVKSIEKKISHSDVNSGAMPADFILIADNEYDKLGQLKTKKLGKKKNLSNQYTATPVETLTYDYNIRGWLLGVNRSHILTTNGQSGSNFGFELGYDKLTNSSGRNFTAAQYNGNINGMVWRSNGDGFRRKYDFTYDAANRLLQGLFEQDNSSNNWGGNLVNFTVKMGTGLDPNLAYDANGNILRMQQWGLKVSGSSQIDDLQYSYMNTNNSNKLLNVKDLFNNNQTNLSDFRVSALHPTQTKTATTVDYSYDVNGNMVKDFNKDIVTSAGANGIVYNHLNLPSVITLKKSGTANKGTITYTYDAVGSKIKKETIDQSSATVVVTTTTLYLGGLVYESKVSVPAALSDYTDRLQFAGQEEGRIRFVPQAGSIPARFAYDYFIKDHLGNVRMVLTEEAQQDIYPAATLEGSITTDAYPNAIFKEKDFYTINTANVVSKITATGISNYTNTNGITNNNSYSNTSAISDKLYKLQASAGGGVTGLGITLKVMSGDKVDILGKSYYFQQNSTATNYNVPFGDITGGLLGSPASSAIGKTTAAELNGIVGITGAITSFLQNTNRNTGGTATTPRAYINYILLDENFNFITGSFSKVGSANAVKDHFNDAAMQNINVTANGYIYVYVSNESPVSVFFDNLQLVHTRGPILEETHYYPFGLVMSGISSKSLNFGSPSNKLKYISKEEQRQEFSDGSGLEWLDYGARMYDNQIGRWMVLDSKSEAYYSSSPFVYALNNPIVNFDPNGKWTVSRHHTMTVMALSSAGIGGTQAYWIAHYSAVYADNPGNHLMLNNLVHPTRGDIYRREIDYSFTKKSQVTDYPNYHGYNFNVWHSMRSVQEKQRFENGTIGGISAEGATQRGMEFGWDEVFSAAKSGTKMGDLKKNSWQIQSLGQGLHALQDAYAHHGRDDVGFSHLRRDVIESNKAAEGITNSAVAVYALLTKDYNSVGKMMDANKGSLGFISTEGMSTQQIMQVFTAIQNYLTDHKPKR